MVETTIDELLLIIQGLFKGGFKEKGKIVRKCTPTSGALYLHKSYIGRKFDVYLIPVEEDNPTVAEETKKAEESLGNMKKNLEELKSK